MFNIQTLNKIADIGIDNFDKAKYTVNDGNENPHAILVRSASMHDMDFGDNLLSIARAGAGVNNIPVEDCTKKGICVFNTPGANANAVKELVFLGLLISSRKVPDALEWVETLKGNGDQVGKMVEKGKSNFAGPEIMNKTLGIIGLGAIGVLVANAAISLGMKVIGYDPYLSIKAAWGLSPSVENAKSMDEIYAKSDYITIHIPFNDTTKNTIDAEAISKMKPNVRILNFARGGLVDDDAVIEAIDNNKVNCYVTDFPSDNVIGKKGIVAIPHLGASTPESEDNCAYMAAVQTIDYVENGNIKNSVNLPDAEMERTSAERICVIHKNIPATLSKITTVFSGSNVNIENMVNKSKKEYAYTILDVDDIITDEMYKNVENIDGVISVRCIK